MSAEELLSMLDEFVASSGPPNPKSASSENRQLLELISDAIVENYHNTLETEPICSALTKVYNRGGTWRLFVLQVIPAFVGTYMVAVSKGEKKQCGHLEAFMLSIYNCEILKSDGTRKVEKVRLPTLNTPSIYHHDPTLLASGGGLTETALSRFNAKDVGVVQAGPYPSWHTINAENRFVIMTFLLKVYNSHLNVFDQSTLATYCKMCNRLCRSGFHFPETDLVQRVVRSEQGKDVFRHVIDYADSPRVPLHPVFMLELLNGVYFAMFNNLTLLGVQALDDVRQRASFELYPDVLLVTNAIANSLVENPSGSPGEGPMGIRAVTNDEAATATASGGGKESISRRRLITNSSLRIKKLADDIPLRAPGESPSSTDTSTIESPVKSKTSGSSTPSGTNRPKLLSPSETTNGGGGGHGGNKQVHHQHHHLPSLKESRSEISMQDLLQKRAQAEAASMVHATGRHEPPTLAEEDNFDIASSEEPTPRRAEFAMKEQHKDVIENGHNHHHSRPRSIVETDV